MKKVSTTKLASEYLNLDSARVWDALTNEGYIDERRNITTKGEEVGGETKVFKGTQYIAWPIDFDPLNRKVFGVNALAEKWKADGNPAAGMTGRAINRFLLEYGFIEKKFGGIQRTHEASGKSSVVWPEDFLSSSQAKNIESKLDERNIIPENEKKETKSNVSRRRGQYQTEDGHWVASRGEALIDNFLYRYYIPHSYDRELIVHEEFGRPRCDFFIPAFKSSMNGQPVYIEFWGLDTDEKYKERKREKLEIYKKYEFNLIQISDKDTQILSTVLGRKLLKFGIDLNNQ